MIFNDLGGFYHPFQIADSALVFVLVLFGGMILKVLAEISVGSGFFDCLQRFLADYHLAVFDFLFHFLYVFSGQFVVHSGLHFCLFSQLV